jgi:NAD(P)-dependent dehydrogenase (short-subunit alcohol dehydrogenase family)
VGLLDGKVVAVTGAARGIGLAVARACVEEGASVALIDVVTEQLEEAARSIDPSGA